MTSAWVGRLLVGLVLLAACGLPATAQDSTWRVEGKLLGEAEGAGFEKSEDVSGIACDSAPALPRLCLLVDDETQGAQIVLLKEGELLAGDFIPLTKAQHGGKPLELDAEAVAFDNGAFYVAGSHGRARHESNSAKEAKNDAKAAATRQIFRITLPASAVDMTTGRLIGPPGITPSTALADILRGQPELSQAYDKALEDNGLTIEGLAVRDQRLYLGMRGPVIGSDAAVLSVAVSAVFDGQPAQPRLYKLALGTDTAGRPRGIRDLAATGAGFLVLAGPVNDPEDDTAIRPGDYAIYLWDGENPPDRRLDLNTYGRKAKPEALLPLDGDAGRVRVLLMFDGPKEGAPRALDVSLR